MSELYQINIYTVTAEGITASVQLNPDHAIFAGHFPGQPVMPGVCMMELVNAVAEKKIKAPCRITGGPLIKFLHMVDPRLTPALEVRMSIQENNGRWLADGKLFSGETIFVKFRLELTVVRESSAVRPDIF